MHHAIRKIFKITFLLVVLCNFQMVQTVTASQEHELLSFVNLAMLQSDAAFNVRDEKILGKLDIAIAEQQFVTRIVPLTTIGFTEGTGSQQLGVEFQRDMEAGTEVTYGFVGNRVEESTDYVIENSHSAKAFVRISQGIFRRWGQEYNLTGLDVAKLQNGLNQIGADHTLQTITLETVRKYYALLLEDHLLQKGHEALSRSKEHLESAKSRQSVGLVSKVDVYRAELAALSAENMLHNQERSRQRALDDFREQLGLEEDSALNWHESIRKLIPVLPEDWEDTVLNNRLEWREHQINMQIAKREMFKVKRDLLPDVGVSLILEQRGEGDTIEGAVELDQTNWAFQIQMNSPLNSMSEEAAVTRKSLEQARLRREGKSLRRKIVREVRDGLADLKTAELQHQLNRRQLEQADLALDLAKIRYEKGLSDNLDMLDAEAAFSDAELAISRSLVAYNNAAVRLAYVMGILDTDWLQMSVK